MADGDNPIMTTKGTLFKWTNYVHGWQPRYFILKNGILMYHKSEQETSFGCRGAIAVKASTFALHEFDFCRFDVGVCDYVWYLRANSKEERDKWILALEEQARSFDLDDHNQVNNQALTNNSITTDNDNHIPTDLTQQQQQHQTPIPVQSSQNQQQSQKSSTMFVQQSQDQQHLQYSDNFCDAQEHFEDPIADITDMPTLVDYQTNNTKPIVNLIDTDDDLNRGGNSCLMNDVVLKETNGHGESHVATQANQNSFKSIQNNNNSSNSNNSSSSNHNLITNINNNNNMTNTNNTNGLIVAKSLPPQPPNSPLWPKIDQLTRDQLYYAQIGLGPEGSTDGWQLFAEEGQMRLYTRELEIDGLACDPLKAVHVVKGISGYEMCHRFFSSNTRFEWETTLESMKVIEKINEDTLIFHQVHKRIWPAAQRDAVFWSHIRQIDEPKPSNLSRDDINPTTRPDLKLHNVWIVCNNSIDKPEIPVSFKKLIPINKLIIC